MGQTYIYLAKAHLKMDDFKKTESFLKKANEVFEKTGDKLLLADIYIVFMKMHFLKKEYEDALSIGKRLLDLAEELKAKEQRIVALRLIGRIFSEARYRGYEKKVLSYLKQSIDIARQENMVFELARSLYEFVEITFSAHIQIKDRSKFLQDALNLFKKISAKEWLKKVRDLQHKIKNP